MYRWAIGGHRRHCFRFALSAFDDVTSAGSIVRVRYHGVLTLGPFEPLYMGALDLNWNLVAASDVYLELAVTPSDDEGILHAYVYVNPSGYGMVNAMPLASGLAEIDPALSADER
jgi:hypothetical protein